MIKLNIRLFQDLAQIMVVLGEELGWPMFDIPRFEVGISNLVLADVTIGVLEVGRLFNGLRWPLGLCMLSIFFMLFKLHRLGLFDLFDKSGLHRRVFLARKLIIDLPLTEIDVASECLDSLLLLNKIPWTRLARISWFDLII